MSKENMSVDLEDLWQQAQVTPTAKLSAHEAAVRIVLSARALEKIEDALDVAVEIIQAQRAAAVAELWQTIDTAPTDDSFWAICYYKKTPLDKTWNVSEAFSTLGQWWVSPFTEDQYEIFPTHFMLLPQPPSQEEGV